MLLHSFEQFFAQQASMPLPSVVPAGYFASHAEMHAATGSPPLVPDVPLVPELVPLVPDVDPELVPLDPLDPALPLLVPPVSVPLEVPLLLVVEPFSLPGSCPQPTTTNPNRGAPKTRSRVPIALKEVAPRRPGNPGFRGVRTSLIWPT